MKVRTFLQYSMLIVGAISADAAQPEQVKFPITDTLDMAFKRIPAGSFTMGSPEDEKDRQDDEGPLHKVTITKPFYMGIFEVTQDQWNKVMGIPAYTNPSKFAGRPDNPVEQISWKQV